MLAYENTGVHVEKERVLFTSQYLGFEIWSLGGQSGFYVEAAWDCGRGFLADSVAHARKLIWRFWHPEMI